MSYLNRKSDYDKYPATQIAGFEDAGIVGYDAIVQTLLKNIHDKTVIVVDCYPGVDDSEVLSALKEGLQPDCLIQSEDMFYDEQTLNTMMAPFLTKDRIRGVMYYGSMHDFVDEKKRVQLKKKAEQCNGLCLVYGVGASMITTGDVLVYADMTRWEIQLRYRKGMPNFRCHNENEDVLRKYKRGFFIEWRISDRHKTELFEKIDYYLDTNIQNNPKMINGEAFLSGLRQISQRPFRLVPYFDPGVWGGQWMKEVCALDPKEDNYAWSFDGVPEENSINLKYSDVIIQTPAMNVVKYMPVALLGKKNYARFGAEFPIRFDFLDAMGGQNLSLQVHPTTEYIRTHFGMPYTQDESYYILDAQEGGGVYLGLKENIDSKQVIEDLYRAQKGEISFDADRYINRFPARKHDHFLIPAGTVHCSSAGCMVLEISATPYIFTFKLWDWDRVGLDGLPRPIHIEDGEKVIDWSRTTQWVKDNLVSHFECMEKGEGYEEVKTGLHELEFIETRVVTSLCTTVHDMHDGVHVLNLVDGNGARIESVDHSFAPFTLHYAETLIIPAAVKRYSITPLYEGEEIKVVRAYVRS